MCSYKIMIIHISNACFLRGKLIGNDVNKFGLPNSKTPYWYKEDTQLVH